MNMNKNAESVFFQLLAIFVREPRIDVLDAIDMLSDERLRVSLLGAYQRLKGESDRPTTPPREIKRRASPVKRVSVSPERVIALLNEGRTPKEVAQEVGCSTNNIYLIRSKHKPPQSP